MWSVCSAVPFLMHIKSKPVCDPALGLAPLLWEGAAMAVCRNEL